MSFFLRLLIVVVSFMGLPNELKSENNGDLTAGRLIFKTYCSSCHGELGKGDGPAAIALNPKPRDLSDKEYMDQLDKNRLAKVIKKGGPAVGKSPLMPAIGAGFNDKQLNDVIAFILSLSSPIDKGELTKSKKILEGKSIFKNYCASCHGEHGYGDGPVAVALNPKPANFSDKSFTDKMDDTYLAKVIKKGGSAVGKSPIMPAIGAGFNEQQLDFVIAFIRSCSEDILAKGNDIFITYCADCHGKAGAGDGESAELLDTKPRDLTDKEYMDKLDDKYLIEVLKRGGASVGKSSEMHSMGAGLDAEQINAIIAFIRQLNSK